MGQKTLVVVVGPTSVGKTAVAIQLAQSLHTEILSADSRQFYVEMSIGTAKPSLTELDSAKHHFINSTSITNYFSVGDFEQEALKLIDQLFENRHILILTGGSGLYIDAVCKGFDMIPKPAEGVREALNSELQIKGLEALAEELKSVDPIYFSQVDDHNPQRVIRALEVWRSTGKTFSSFRKNTNTARSFKMIWIGLDVPREMLYQRINDRVDKMMDDGLLEEVRSLYRFKNYNALKTVGYTELFDHFDGKRSLEESIALIKQNTRKFAKRQLTWFRKNEEIRWFDPADQDRILDYIQQMPAHDQACAVGPPKFNGKPGCPS